MHLKCVNVAAVPMPLFGEQRQSHSSMGGMSAPPPAVKLEPGDSMLGMFPVSAPQFPAVSSGAPMYNYPFHDGMHLLHNGKIPMQDEIQ